MRMSVGRRVLATASGRPRVREMVQGDLDEATRAMGAAFGLDLRDARIRSRMRDRLAHLLSTDPGGAFVGERGGQVVGVAQAYLREGLWCLSMLAVDPRVQGGGIGRILFEHALGYGSGRPGLIVGSNDSRALRLYAAAGFSLRPSLEAHGVIDRGAIPSPSREIRVGTADDLEPIAAVSRAVRGAAHTCELAFALRRGADLLVLGDRGFAVVEPGAGVWLLAAADEPAATELLWSALRLCGGVERPVRWITSGQDWAVDVVVRAGLRVHAYGALCVRGDPGPLRPFLPSASFS